MSAGGAQVEGVQCAPEGSIRATALAKSPKLSFNGSERYSSLGSQAWPLLLTGKIP